MSADAWEECPEEFCHDVGDSAGTEYEYRTLRIDHDGARTSMHCYVCGYALTTGPGLHEETRGNPKGEP